MDTWVIAAVLGVLIVLIAGVLLAQRGRRPALAESYYGPLPERDAEGAEVTDPTQFGQVTPGAVTPAAAGSPEEFYEQTGVGSEGPKHLSGPPPATSAPRPAQGGEVASPHHPADGGWSTDERDSNRGVLLAIVAAAGATVGLGVFAFLRRRAQRRSRLARLRQRARDASAAARDAVVLARDRAATLPEALPEGLETRAGAGGGLAVLLAALALFAALRRQRREAEAERLAAEARLRRAEAARKRGLLRLKFHRGWLSRQTERLDQVPSMPDKATEKRPAWMLVAVGIALVAFGITVARRAMRQEPDWKGAMVSDSAPAREPPASP